MVDKNYEEKVSKNRKTLLSISDIIINLSKRNMALCGSWTGKSEDGNLCNFIIWKSSFNATLQNHLETAPKNAKYITPKIQNELIASCGAEIEEEIVTEIKKAKYFSVLEDETMDVSSIELPSAFTT